MVCRRLVGLFVLWLCVSTFAPLFADEIDRQELHTLDRYLQRLAQGAASDARLVDELAEIGWPGIERIVQRYSELPEPIEPHTQRAFQALLERTTRTLLLPWPLVELYAPELAAHAQGELDVASSKSAAAWAQLFSRLQTAQPDRRSWDLIVRLAPTASLDELAKPAPPATEHIANSMRLELIAAWNRRLARGAFTQPLPVGERRWASVCDRLVSQQLGAQMEAELELLGRRDPVRYEQQLDIALAHSQRDVVLVALRVQEKLPRRAELSVKVVERFREDSAVVEQALKVIAADARGDHAARLRTLWPSLPPPPSRALYFALLAMSVHATDNQALALAALKQQPFEFLDAALGVLRAGPAQPARDAVAFLLAQPRGHEEALRLAAERKFEGFEERALKIALDETRDVVARQTALRYLQRADGSTRRRAITLLGHKNGDVRLAAIQLFGPPEKLTAQDRDDIGPSLIQVASQDASEGHRQEAIFALGQWRDPNAAPFFRQLLKQNLPVVLADEPFNHAQYWRYRLRLVALVGLARLDDAAAIDELAKLHRTGGPTERMDVLLAQLSLGRCPDWVREDWRSPEPKLIATAVRLTLDHGSAELRSAMRTEFASRPPWKLFADSGVDDHNLLKMLGELERTVKRLAVP